MSTKKPARLAHIHKAKEADKAMQTHFHTYLYKKGSYEARRFEGEAVEAQAAATHYADQLAYTCDYADVRDAIGNLVYRVADPNGRLAKGAEA